jgi:hypothetical protein
MRGSWCGAIVAALSGAVALTGAMALGEEPPSGEWTLRGPGPGGREVVLRGTERTAGAVASMVWDGREFLDATDHGRELQSAANFDAGTPYTDETFNPTEAGSMSDSAGPRSTSRLLHVVVGERTVQTSVQMAFWLRPGERSNGQLAKNDRALSNHVLTKRIALGWGELASVIRYDVTFSMPNDERHTYAQFEALTAYQPASFGRFHRYEAAMKRLVPADDDLRESPRPPVMATEDGRQALGVYSPQQPSPGWSEAGYGLFRFPAAGVVKWNCVFRERDASGVPAGERTYRQFVVFGTLEDVEQALVRLHEAHADAGSER